MVATVDGCQMEALRTVSMKFVSQKNSGSVFSTTSDGTRSGTRVPSGTAEKRSGR